MKRFLKERSGSWKNNWPKKPEHRWKRSQKAAGWQPESCGSLKQELTEAYRKVHGKKPIFVSIPATLECGEIKERLKIKEAVSVGPIMKDYHTPKERLQIESAAGLYRVLKEMLALA